MSILHESMKVCPSERPALPPPLPLSVGYLVELLVSLQDQINDVADEGDLPLREAPLEELLFAQDRFIVEDVS